MLLALSWVPSRRAGPQQGRRCRKGWKKKIPKLVGSWGWSRAAGMLFGKGAGAGAGAVLTRFGGTRSFLGGVSCPANDPHGCDYNDKGNNYSTAFFFSETHLFTPWCLLAERGELYTSRVWEGAQPAGAWVVCTIGEGKSCSSMARVLQVQQGCLEVNMG